MCLVVINEQCWEVKKKRFFFFFFFFFLIDMFILKNIL